VILQQQSLISIISHSVTLANIDDVDDDVDDVCIEDAA